MYIHLEEEQLKLLDDLLAEAAAFEVTKGNEPDGPARKLREHLQSQAEEGPNDGHYVVAAEERHADDEVQIDSDALVSVADEGAWVHAWVWVPNDCVMGLEYDDEEEDLG